MSGVIFERFRAFNAYPFKEIDLNLRRQGLVRLAGSNGSGKSSAFNLFTQVCQGTSPNASKKSDMMFTDKDFLLEVTFEKNGSRYIAAQATKCQIESPEGVPYGSGVYLFRDGTDISMHRDPDTVKLIRSTLGWSIEEWYGYVLLAQRTTHTLIMGTRSERQNYLSALFNLTPLDNLASHFKSKAEEFNEKIEKLEKDKQELQIKQQMLGLGSSPLKETLEEVVSELKLVDKKITKLQDEQIRFETLTSLQNKLKALPTVEVDLVTLEKELTKLDSLQQDHKTAIALKGQILEDLDCLLPIAKPKLPDSWKQEYETFLDIDEKKEQEELTRLIQLESSLSEAVPKVQIPQDFTYVLNSSDINLASIKRQITEIEVRPAPPSFSRPMQIQIATLREKNTDISYKILNLKKEIQQLALNESSCTKCGTILDVKDRSQKKLDKRLELEELEDQLTVVSNKLSIMEGQDTAWRSYESLGPDRSSELPDLKTAVNLFEKKQQYLILKKNHENYQRYQEHLKEIDLIPELTERIRIYRLKKQYQVVQQQQLKYETYIERKNYLTQKLNSLPETTDLSAKISVLKQQQAALESHLTLSREIKDYEGTLDCSDKLLNFKNDRDAVLSKQAQISQEIKRLDALAQDISLLQEKIASQSLIVREQKRYSILAKGFGKAGTLRELQLSKFSRYLEEALLSHTIKQLPDHRFQLRVEDGIDILAEYIGKEKPNTAPYDIKFMSGGEQGALSIAFLFALDDLLPPDRRTNLKILDECTAFLDDGRQRDFIQYTLPLLKEKAETIIVITHTYAADSSAFDKIWEVSDGRIKDVTSELRDFN